MSASRYISLKNSVIYLIAHNTIIQQTIQYNSWESTFCVCSYWFIPACIKKKKFLHKHKYLWQYLNKQIIVGMCFILFLLKNSLFIDYSYLIILYVIDFVFIESNCVYKDKCCSVPHLFGVFYFISMVQYLFSVCVVSNILIVGNCIIYCLILLLLSSPPFISPRVPLLWTSSDYELILIFLLWLGMYSCTKSNKIN